MYHFSDCKVWSLWCLLYYHSDEQESSDFILLAMNNQMKFSGSLLQHALALVQHFANRKLIFKLLRAGKHFCRMSLKFDIITSRTLQPSKMKKDKAATAKWSAKKARQCQTVSALQWSKLEATIQPAQHQPPGRTGTAGCPVTPQVGQPHAVLMVKCPCN